MHDTAITSEAAAIEPGSDPFAKTRHAVNELVEAVQKIDVQTVKMRTAAIERSADAMERATTVVAALLAQATIMNDTVARVLARHRTGGAA